MDFTIRPNVGIGGVSFGMTNADVRRALPAAFESFKRSENAVLPCDYFSSLGVFVYYRQPGVVEAMEFCPPASVMFDGENLLGMPYSSLIQFFRDRDPAAQADGGMLISRFLGLGAYVPSGAKNKQAKSESLIVFEKGYFG